uniref:Uncharacterized protein n=1 Tax=Rhizophora mucronata TaxID=61149 RepID=A0A2P2J6X1_RHIMU
MPNLQKNGEKQSMDGIKEATDQVKSENETIIEPLTQEPSVTGGPTGSEKQVQLSIDTAPAEPVKLDKSGTEKFVLAPEMLPAEEKFESSKGPTSGKAAIDAPGKVEAEKLTEGTKSSQTDVEKKPEKTK